MSKFILIIDKYRFWDEPGIFDILTSYPWVKQITIKSFSFKKLRNYSLNTISYEYDMNTLVHT